MHLSDALGVVAGLREDAGQRDRIPPLRTGVVPGETVVLVLESGHQRGAGRDAGRTGRIGAGEIDPLPGELVKVRRVGEAGAVQPQRVAPHLIDHDHQYVRSFSHQAILLRVAPRFSRKKANRRHSSLSEF